MSTYFYTTRESSRSGFNKGFVKLRNTLRSDVYPQFRRQKYSLAYRVGSNRIGSMAGFEFFSYCAIVLAYLLVFFIIVS